MGQVTVLQTPVPFESLPRRKRLFVEEYVKTGDAKRSYLAAGYKDSHIAAKKARELRNELTRYIGDAVREYASSNEMAILGLNALESLAREAESEAVRLNAAKELLSRTVPEAPKEVTVNHNHVHSLSDAAITQRKEKLIKDLGLTKGITLEHE